MIGWVIGQKIGTEKFKFSRFARHDFGESNPQRTRDTMQDTFIPCMAKNQVNIKFK